MKVSFDMYFSGQDRPSLTRTEFRCSLLSQKRVSVRGKTAWRLGSNGSFDWSKGVRALSCLLLQYADGQNQPLIGPSAKTLDYCLGKQPHWLLEMFTEPGQARLLRKLFRRSNPEGKRIGPVEVSLNAGIWGAGSIRVYLNGHRVSAKRLLPFMQSTNASDSRSTIERIIGESIWSEMRYLWSLPERYVASTMPSLANRYAQSSLIQSIGGERFLAWMSRYRPTLAVSSKASLISRLQSGPPISVCLAPAHVLGCIIFFWLRDHWKLPLKFDISAPTSFHQLHALQQPHSTARPDVVLAGLVPGLHLANRSSGQSYDFLFPIGVGSQAKLSSASSKRNSFTYFKDICSNYELMQEVYGSKESTVTHGSSGDILRRALQGDLDQVAFSFAPYSYILQEAGLSLTMGRETHADLVLFYAMASASFRRLPAAHLLELAVRRAYAELVMNPNYLAQAVKYYLSEEEVLFQVADEASLFELADQLQMRATMNV